MDPYEELGVPKEADNPTIKRAYRRAALERHPDVSREPDAQEKFQRAQDAYRMLSDPKSRAAYDRAAQSSWSWTSGGAAANAGDDGAAAREYARKWRASNPMPGDLNDDLGSVLSDLFGGVREGAPSVLSDVLQFFERGAGINDTNSAAASSKSVDSISTDIDQVLRSKNNEVLEAELREVNRVADAADALKRGAEEEERKLNERSREWERRARNLDTVGDLLSRDAAREMLADIDSHRHRLQRRIGNHSETSRVAHSLRQRIEQRLDVLRKQGDSQHSEEQSNGSVPNDLRKTQPQRHTESKRNVDDELERMKREMGL